MEKDRCQNISRGWKLRCELEANHKGPHWAKLSEESELMWEDQRVRMNFELKK